MPESLRVSVVAELESEVKFLRMMGRHDEADNLCALANEMGFGY